MINRLACAASRLQDSHNEETAPASRPRRARSQSLIAWDGMGEPLAWPAGAGERKINTGFHSVHRRGIDMSCA